MKIKKGENVIVITGKDNGKTGKVTRVLRDRNKVVVEGINMTKRRIRPRRAGEKGQVVEVALPLQISNVLHFCEKCKKGVRVKIEVKKDKKLKVCAKCGKEI